MADQANIFINLEGNILGELNQLQEEFRQLTTRVDQLDDTVGTAFSKMEKQSKRANQSLRILAYGALSDITSTFGPAFQQATEGTFDFDHSLRELSAITDVVGDDLELIGDNARQNAKDFGGSASESLRSYTILLSKLTPEIAKNPEALSRMGEQVAVLSRTMGGDSVGAVNALSSAMNQFNVDLSDPMKAADEAEKIINQMAAAAKVGSAEVPQLAQALDQSGAIAKSANISFAETAAALEVLGKFGKEGAEGGVALRNVLTIMQREEFIPERVREQLSSAGVSVDVLADKSLSLHERLGELQKIAGDDALLSGMFGMENTVAITGLLTQRDLLQQYTEDIRENQTAAREMSDTIGASYQETKNRILADFEDIKLSIFSLTGDTLPYIDVMTSGLLSIVSIMPGIMAMTEAIKMLSASQKVMAVATNIASIATTGWGIAQQFLNAAFYASPIGWIVAGIGLVVGAVVYAWNHFEGFRAAIFGIWEATKQVFSNIASFIGDMLQPFFDAVEFIQEGEWGKAALALGKGLLNVATAPFQFVERLVTGEITEGVADAYAQGDADGRASFQASQEEDDPGTVNSPDLGSSSSSLDPIAVDPASPLGRGSGSRSGGDSSGGSAGSAVRNNNITINKLVEKIEIHSERDIPNLKDKITQILVEMVRDAELAIS